MPSNTPDTDGHANALRADSSIARKLPPPWAQSTAAGRVHRSGIGLRRPCAFPLQYPEHRGACRRGLGASSTSAPKT